VKNILWISDRPDWAYDVNTKALSSNMPQYMHHFIYTCQNGRQAVDDVMESMDIIVAMNPAGFYMYSEFDKVVSVLDTVRALSVSQLNCFTKIAGIICNTRFLFNFAKERNDKVLLQPNGLDLDIFQPSEEIIVRDFTIGFAGNIPGTGYAQYKGWDIYQQAIESFPTIRQLNVLYGTNSQIPPNRMVPDFYHKIDCLILPSKNEGCSNVITEALACGIPVICSRVGYHGDSLQNREQCLFIDRNSQSIKDAIFEISKDKELFEKIKKKAREFACQYHDIKKTAQEYAKFFETVML